MKPPTDGEIVDWLDREARVPGGLLLHNGTESGRRGLGTVSIGRSLRHAVADAMGRPRPEEEPRHA